MKKIEPLKDHDKINISINIFTQPECDIENWRTLTQNQYSHNTLLSFQNDWHTFLQFCVEKKLTPLPAEVATVRRFIDETAIKRKASSIKRYIVTVGHLHRLHQQIDPTRHREVRYSLNRLYQDKLEQATQANAFQLSHLHALQKKFESSKKIKDIRDLLIWSLCFEAMLKRSELAALTMHQLTKGNENYLLQLNEQVIELSVYTSSLIDKWLMKSEITQGALLRRLSKHGQLGETSMDHSSIYRVFRRAATELGFVELTFSGQSARVGASKDMADIGKSIKEIQHQGRWRSPAMPAQYVGDLKTRDAEMAKYKRKINKD